MSPNIFRLEFYAFVCSPPDAERFSAFCAVIDNASVEATLATVNRVLAAHTLDLWLWNMAKDRSVADAVRGEMLSLLSEGE